MDEIRRLRHGGSDTILRCAYSHQRWYRLESQDMQNDSTQRVDENVFENGEKFSNKNGYPHMWDSASVCFKFLILGSTY